MTGEFITSSTSLNSTAFLATPASGNFYGAFVIPSATAFAGAGDVTFPLKTIVY